MIAGTAAIAAAAKLTDVSARRGLRAKASTIIVNDR